MDLTMDSTLQPALNARAPNTSSHPASTSTMANQPQNPIKVASKATSNAASHVLGAPSQQNVSSPQPLSMISQSSNHTSNSHTLFNPAPAQTSNNHPSIEMGGPTATAPFLQDFSLVAEAAKRAQMGIVMRDLESVTL